MPSLFPQINLPTLVAPPTTPDDKKYLPAPAFNFETGDFVFDGAGRMVMADGKTAFEDWCLKVCGTERGTKLAYSTDIGTEFEALRQESDPNFVRSSIIRTITETILVHPAAEYIKKFSFEMEGDHFYVKFMVKGRDWAEASQLALEM